MNLTDQLLSCAQTYAQHRKIAMPTLSGEIFNDSRTLPRVSSGGSLTVRNFERAMTWLSDAWPSDLEWPVGIDRPERAHSGSEAA